METSHRPMSIRRRLARRHPVAVFTALAFGLSWWPALGRFDNPESAVVVPIGPSIAGLLLLRWQSGRRGLGEVVRTERMSHVGHRWWTLLIPVGIAASAAPTAVLLGASPPAASDAAMSGLLFALLPLTLVVTGPLGEELGWRGFLLPHLLRTRTPLAATATLVPIWLAFHLPLVITNPSRYGLPWAIIIGSLAVTMTWLHLRTGGSLRLAVAFHAVTNTSAAAGIQAFSDGDQPLVAAVTAALWLLIAVVIALGPLRGPAHLIDDPAEPSSAADEGNR